MRNCRPPIVVALAVLLAPLAGCSTNAVAQSAATSFFNNVASSLAEALIQALTGGMA